MSRRRAILVAGLCLVAGAAGCSGHAGARGGGATTVSAAALPDPGAETAISDAITRALESDARSTDPAGLYTDDGTVVANGTVRLTYPRFAGVAPGGEIAIMASRIEIRRALAWADVEYRWQARDANLVHLARASFVLAPADGGWRIVHAHSSAARD